MSLSVLFRKKVEFGRILARSVFLQTYWSANVLNLDDKQMPQHDSTPFTGEIAVLKLWKGAIVSNRTSHLDDWLLGGVIDAFFFGLKFPKIVREHKEVLAPGSLGPVSRAPRCDLRRFCPSLFCFSDDKQASVSLGIERLASHKGRLVIPAGTKILGLRA